MCRSSSAGSKVTNSRVVGDQAVAAGNATASGGGLYLNDVQVNLTSDRFKSNKAVGGPIVSEESSSSWGQASGGAISLSLANATVANSQFRNNIARTQNVDRQYAPADAVIAGQGGAIANLDGTISIAGDSFVNNQAIGSTAGKRIFGYRRPGRCPL